MAAIIQMTNHCALLEYHIKWRRNSIVTQTKPVMRSSAGPSFQEQVGLLRFPLPCGIVTDQIQNHVGLDRVF